ncbi:MAG: hypothetical protein HY015_04020 [Bacteroidetes bacterium]|nr:hypothetical protein [Bacteroidota bacterium]MBI3482129.1 hypothetical protein [Bacteroidota bacterium]
MNKIRLILHLAIVITFFGVLPAWSQSSINKLVVGTQQDANTLVNGYLSPALSVIGYGLNQGWYNTAQPHKVLGFDLTATFNFIKVPTSALTYYVDNSKLNNIELLGSSGAPQSGYVPTVFGSDVAPTYRYKNPPNTQFSGAPGVNLSKVPVISNSLPVPIAQVGIGLPKGFELKVRFVPAIKFGDNSASSFNLFGVGVMNDVKQYIPGVKTLPFDLSAFVGYTKMDMNVTFDASHSQKGTLSSSATTIQGIISKKFAVLTAYAALGYNIANTKSSVTGNYDLTGLGTYVPIQVNLSGAATGPRATFGLRLKLAVFTFHGEYTAQKYSSLALGFGIAVR